MFLHRLPTLLALSYEDTIAANPFDYINQDYFVHKAKSWILQNSLPIAYCLSNLGTIRSAFIFMPNQSKLPICLGIRVLLLCGFVLWQKWIHSLVLQAPLDKMHRSARLTKKQANAGKESQREPKAKKKRLNEKTSNIIAMDNGTMVEAFKYLNYCQLAKNSIVSERFRDLIQTHRHKLALLYVISITMDTSRIDSAAINIFDKKLFSEAYDEWVVRNGYSKQVSLDDQIANTRSTRNVSNVYDLSAIAYYKDLNHRKLITYVFTAKVELNHENWPLFQHFVRLATDPFIYIHIMQLTYQNDVLNLLAGAINPDRDRLQCEILDFNLKGNSHKSIIWMKNHVRCNRLRVEGKANLNKDETFLDFLVTGGHCVPSINIDYNDISKAMVGFVQKFMALKISDDSQIIEALEVNFKAQAIELLKRNYGEFIVKQVGNHHIFEFVNNAIGKKLQLNSENYSDDISHFSVKINNL
ncbi:hypothetical protein Ddc_09745 [Ditylenchus destructor]|nr:hypothetical protein Ddc_09745 [Ditylenchus destructor]